jgi:hypothetical protein
MEGGTVGHNIEKEPPKDHPSQICFNLVQRFQWKNFTEKNGIYVKLLLAM